MLEGALTSFTTCDAYRYFADQVLLMTLKVGHAHNIHYQRIALYSLIHTFNILNLRRNLISLASVNTI